MENWQQRTALLLGEEGLDILSKSRIAVLGLGGVGSAASEALCRAGVGHLLLVDSDSLSETNLNRQLIATVNSVGMPKAEASRLRLLSIHPQGDFRAAIEMFMPDHSDFLFDYQPDFVLDAIDNITAKLFLAERCDRLGIPLISSMGTGNRLDPTSIRIGDIADTAGTGCPLARVMRHELKARGVGRLRVVYSVEPPRKGIVAPGEAGRHPPGSTPFVPCCAGMAMAAAAVAALIAK